MISEQKAVGAFGEGTARSDELNEELGLNVYDFGARNYDPALGRWMNIDPLAESFFSDTPYNYTLNNPISNIDPDGRFTFSLSGQAAQDFARNLQRELDQEENKKMMYGDEEHDPPPGGKVTNFFKGFGNGFKSGWNDTKKFVKSLRTEDGWLDMIRSSEVMFSPSINSNGDSYVKNERQQIYSSASNTLNNLDQLSSYDWGYSFGYASEKLIETVAIRKFGNASKMIDPFSMRGGYGAFGENGLKFGNYRMDLMYANPSAGQGAGTIFSLKQMKSGGSLWRMDYGKFHTTGKMGFHSTVRFHWNGTKYGSTAQRTWYPSSLKAPFFKTLK